MCILVTRHYTCRTRSGQPVDSITHHDGDWIQPCSTPLMATVGASADDDFRQACLGALDHRIEWYDHPCPDCTGHGPTEDAYPQGTTRTPRRVVLSLFPPATSTSPERNAYSRAVHNYASALARLYWTWIGDHWRDSDEASGEVVVERVARRAAVVTVELTCREDSAHGARRLDGGSSNGEVSFCGCPLTAAPLLNNFAAQRRFDMAMQSARAQKEFGYEILMRDDDEEDEDDSSEAERTQPAAGQHWWLLYESAIAASREKVETRFAEMSPWMRTRTPPVLPVVQPFTFGEFASRRDRLVDMLLPSGGADSSSSDKPDDVSSSSSSAAGFSLRPAEEYADRVLRNMSSLLAMDTGLSFPRAVDIFRVLRSALTNSTDGYQPEVSANEESPWPTILANMISENAARCRGEYSWRLDFLLSSVDRLEATTAAEARAVWGWWNVPVHSVDRRSSMVTEWLAHVERHHARVRRAEASVVDLEDGGDGERLREERCYICLGDFRDDGLPPYDVPAAPRVCAGSHATFAGRRCLVCFACKATAVPSCPICRRPYSSEETGE